MIYPKLYELIMTIYNDKSHFVIQKVKAPLEGLVHVAGAKNATLVMICATILVSGKTILQGVPDILDVHSLIMILEYLGAEVTFNVLDHELIVDASRISFREIPEYLMKQTRASILFLGPLLVRFGKAAIGGNPGGDAIGNRPINLHIENLQKLGVDFGWEGSTMHASVNRWQSARIVLAYPSVGATENIMLAAIGSSYTTTIINAAIEPEVCNLIQLLQGMGADIAVTGHATITIRGYSNTLRESVCAIIPDRLEAGALLCAAAMTGGDVTVHNISSELLDVPLLFLEQMGNAITRYPDSIRIQGARIQKAINIKTAPFPGFPTDLQPIFMATLLVSLGVSTIEEFVFENRFHHVQGFSSMGANITIQNPHKLVIHGCSELIGVDLYASDIRAACAYVLAGLIAEGETRVYNIAHFKRGFESLDQKLVDLGGLILLDRM